MAKGRAYCLLSGADVAIELEVNGMILTSGVVSNAPEKLALTLVPDD